MAGSTDLSWLLTRPPVPDDKTFEIALTLGGTVSAGAYTAGAIDFLIQALDCWEKAVAEGDPMAPGHNVVLKVVSGTSGGAVIAATMARALAYEFPPVDAAMIANNQPQAETNPFYLVWNKVLNLDDFLETTDISQGKFLSVLNPAPIDEGAKLVAGFGEGTLALKARRYVASPMQVILTLTNVSGIPFKTAFGACSQTYVNHADYAKFAVAFPKLGTAANVHVQWSVLPDPDQFALSALAGANLPQAMSWTEFAQFACASAAFPLGFPARELQRPAAHYGYRVVCVPQPGGLAVSYVAMTPDWAALRPNMAADGVTYRFLSVDGGATDNEPIELARAALCGYQERNPRAGDAANRAVVLIDPFAGEADLGPADNSGGLFKVAGGVLSSLTQQTRYDTADLVLAADPDVFSRFMLTASRPGVAMGGPALASAGLDAFMGFACEAFARHDYVLGRVNCQAFLRDVFVLDKANPIMRAGWSAAQIAGHRLTGAACLPIIPLMREAAVAETLLPWPKGALDPETFAQAIGDRFAAILHYEGQQQSAVFLKLATWLGANFGQGGVAGTVIGMMNDYLTKAGLAAERAPAAPAVMADVQTTAGG